MHTFHDLNVLGNLHGCSMPTGCRPHQTLMKRHPMLGDNLHATGGIMYNEESLTPWGNIRQFFKFIKILNRLHDFAFLIGISGATVCLFACRLFRLFLLVGLFFNVPLVVRLKLLCQLRYELIMVPALL